LVAQAIVTGTERYAANALLLFGYAMYEAKRAGKGRVFRSNPPAETECAIS
jgi:hypothetical protein